MAALAVAMMIAMAATSTRSDRDIASLVFMDRLNFFRLSVSLGLFRLGLFRFALLPRLHGSPPAFAISITLLRFR
jgi:hypothetical protein